ncbi:LacI family DNA-binding transcriptional regulator [Anaerolentibacter hominis]|uniref:LacI family DNA-binding transcriptional regulator n=1 Tax=Anaerolentibacter hominis TaxID=3079009 RepID=UPI0031B882C4
MATMKDVAREAGVSLGTVSNVLNGHASVQEKNREKVWEAVRKLGFRSNMAARTLRTNSSRNLGLVIPDIQNPYYPELARGVEDAAREAGFTVFLCNDDRDSKKEEDYLEALVGKSVDGIILVKPQVSEELLERMSIHTRFVLVDSGEIRKSNYHVVNVDDAAGIKEGMEYLYTLGHRKIGFIRGMLESYSSKIRANAYVNFLNEKELPLSYGLIQRGDYTWSSGYTAAKEMIRMPEPPTAILASNDVMAIGCMKAIQDSGLRIPEDISVMGYDNVDVCNLCTPSLTTIHQPKYEVGHESLRMLAACMCEDVGVWKDRPEQLILKPRLIERRSVGPALS